MSCRRDENLLVAKENGSIFFVGWDSLLCSELENRCCRCRGHSSDLEISKAPRTIRFNYIQPMEARDFFQLGCSFFLSVTEFCPFIRHKSWSEDETSAASGSWLECSWPLFDIFPHPIQIVTARNFAKVEIGLGDKPDHCQETKRQAK